MPNEKITESPPRPKTFSLKDISVAAARELKDVTGYECSSVVSIRKQENIWNVLIELLEKEGIPDRMDILGLYDVRMDIAGNLLEYERTGLRKRGDTAQATDEE